MPGRMGDGNISAKNVVIVQVDAEKNIILLKGSVPGKKGNLILIRKV